MSIIDADRQRLFAQHVQAAFHDADGDVGVRDRWRADNDCVEFHLVAHRVVVVERLAAQRFRNRLSRRQTSVSDGDQFAGGAVRERCSVSLSDTAGSNHSKTDA